MVSTGTTGYLSVQAIPWGWVTIDQREARETPLKKIPLAAGDHSIQLIDSAKKKRLGASVKLLPEHHVICRTYFKEEKIECHDS